MHSLHSRHIKTPTASHGNMVQWTEVHFFREMVVFKPYGGHLMVNSSVWSLRGATSSILTTNESEITDVLA